MLMKLILMVRQKMLIAFEKPKDKNKFSLVLTGEEAFWKDSAIILKESQFVSFDENGKKKFDRNI